MAASSIIGSLVYSLIYTRTCVSFCNTLIHTERLYTFTAGSQLPTHMWGIKFFIFTRIFLLCWLLLRWLIRVSCCIIHLFFAMFSSRVCTAGFKPSALVSHEAFLWLIHVRCWHYSSLCLQQRQFCYLSEQLQLSSTWREARGRLFESRGGSRHFINGCFEFEQRSLTRCHRWVW